MLPLTKIQQEDDLSNLSYPPDPWQMDQAEQYMLGQTEAAFFEGFSQTTPAETGTADNRSISEAVPEATSRNAYFASYPQGQFPEAANFPPLVARILSYAYSVIVPLTWPKEMEKMAWTYEITRTLDDLAAINEDSCYASATLCYYATLMAAATNDMDLTSQACFFQTQAMSELRQRVTSHSGPYESVTLKAILKLFSAETTLDNTSSARIHLKMLRNVISAEGGVILLDSWYRENLLSADCYFALKYQTRPLFPASEWTPGPLSQPWKARLATARIIEDHAPSVDMGIEHATLRTIISDLRELFKVEGYIRSHDVPSGDQLLRWRQIRKFDCISRLADHQLSVKIYPHLYFRPKLQLAICAAIALMTAMVLGSPEPVRFGSTLVTELHGKVDDARAEVGQGVGDNQDRDEEESDPTKVTFWFLYVGMLGEKTHPVPQGVPWFEQEFLRAADELELYTQKDQENMVKYFLYSSALFEEIQNKHEHRNQEIRKGVYEACGMSWRLPLSSSVTA